MAKDYYAILGVERKATPEEIKKAYHRLALQLHPDRNPGDKQAEERFKDVNEAYAVLSNDEKRKKYDAFGAQGFGEQFSQEEIFQGFDFQSILDELGLNLGGGGVFDSLFGRGKGQRVRVDWGGAPQGHRPPPQKGQDTQTELRISFYESIHGGERVINLPSAKGGWEKVSVKIPAGVSTGKTLRVRGRGKASPRGGEAGDLYLSVVVEPDPVFTRKGNHLYCEVSLPISRLVLGGTAQVPTLDGKKQIKVAPGTPIGTQLRLKTMGAPGPRGGKGDLYVRLNAQIPTDVPDNIKKLFEQLAEEGY